MTDTVEAISRPPPITDGCEKEPIHIPGAIQPHGLLVSLRPDDLTILQVSSNVESVAGVPAARLVGQPIGALLSAEQSAHLKAAVGVVEHEHGDAEPVNEDPTSPFSTLLGPAQLPYHALLHRFGGRVILEMEPASTSGPEPIRPSARLPLQIRRSLSRLAAAADAQELCRQAAEEVRRLTGFDRVMVYRFNEKWDGQVVAEDKLEELPPFLGQHFPAGDIPPQARELYRMNRLRLIADVAYRPVALTPPLDPETQRPLDLTHSTLRSVSPVHIEYLKNMGVGASMSISILRENAVHPTDHGARLLWGLIACHHRTARFLPYPVRTACDFIGHVLSLQLAAREAAEEADRRIRLKSILTRLLQRMAAEENFVGALARAKDELLEYTNAAGAALHFGGNLTLVGETPGEAEVRELLRWLKNRGDVNEETFCTENLASEFPPAQAYAGVASGMLSASISRVNDSYILWFRPEVVRTVEWAGEPHKPARAGWDGTLHPRTSFELWKQTVRGHSLPWTPVEETAAKELRNAVVGIVLKRAEEMALLAEELERSNKELEAFSYSVSHDLRAPFRHIVGFSDLLQKRATNMDETSRRYVSTIAESARYAGHLVDSLLSFSQMGRSALRIVPLDIAAMFAEVRRELEAELKLQPNPRVVQWNLRPMPIVKADSTMIRLVVRNLLANAVKYSRPRDPAIVEAGVTDAQPPDLLSYRQADFVTIYVRDNGVGFDMKYAAKLFGVFQRLHRAEDFEGTGIGLANVRRIVERHGGRAWAVGEPDLGATFYFSLPAWKEGQETP